MKGKILLVDDSDAIVRLVGGALQGEGYQVFHAEDADAAFGYLKRDSADLVLLDIELPGISGMKLLELLKQDPRTAGVPIIMLTLHKEEAAKLKGLEGGADDYVTKPFSTAELVARVGAVLRRSRNSGKLPNVLSGAGIEVDLDRREVSVKGKRSVLTPAEYELLVLLLRRKGHVLSYSGLAEALSGGRKDVTSSNLYVHLTNLRAKLGPAGKKIETVYGAGYRFLED